MKMRIALILPVIFVFAAFLTLSTQAAISGNELEMVATLSQAPASVATPSPLIMQGLKKVDSIDNEAMPRGWAKAYLNIHDWWCISGSGVDVWINNQYLGICSQGPGLYYIAKIKKGYKYQLYCRDSDGSPSWKSKKTTVNSAKITWGIYCY